MASKDLCFLVSWLMPLTIAAAPWVSPAWGFAVAVALIAVFASIERLWPQWTSGPASPQPRAWFRFVARGQEVVQIVVLAVGVGAAVRHVQAASGVVEAVVGCVALGLAAGMATGSQGITVAHELGHSRSRIDRVLAWMLMSQVLYAHFMVEHYRGHHVRAATHDDPATARRGETLWRFLPRTLVGSWRSAWRLEAAQLGRLRRSWWRSPLAWACAGQATGLVVLTVLLGWPALVFWLVQAAHAVSLLELINYIEHYGLERRVVDGRAEPVGMGHAWNADAALTNCVLVNLQRHSDHHMHAWKPYETLDDLPGPRMPYGYAATMLLASMPQRWFAVMHPRVDAWALARRA